MRIVNNLTIDEETGKAIWVQTEEEDAPIIERPIEEVEAERIQSIKAKAGTIILSKYSIEKQSSAQLGIYGEEYLATMKAFIADIIKQSNELELDVSKTADDFVLSNIGGN